MWNGWFPFDEFRPYQEEGLCEITEAFEKHKFIIGELPTGCHGVGTPILMFDGSIKAVEDVEVGDLLMGADSTPRTVLTLYRGNEFLYEVTPTKGASFICNENHVLSLVRTNLGKKYKTSEDAHIENITIKDYLTKTKWFKHVHKLYRNKVDFSKKELPIPPYILGLWLGDGSTNDVEITNTDSEVIKAWTNYAEENGWRISQRTNTSGCPQLRIVDRNSNGINFRDLLRTSAVYEYKEIPHKYLTSNTNDRLELLAGLLDTDGHLSTGCYDFIQKNIEMAEGTAFLCRSLGLAAYIQPSVKGFTREDGSKFSGDSYRVSISGDLSIIPNKVARRQAKKRIQIKNVLRTGFTLKKLDKGDFYGFNLDGDHLYLLGDFTVTHNSGKSPVALAIAKHYGSAYLCTALKHLQDQYIQDFEEHLRILKGKSNYDCSYDWSMSRNKEPKTCESAPCGINIKTKAALAVTKSCQSKGACTYLNQRNAAVEGPLTLFNFSNLLCFSAINNPKLFKPRNILILDECYSPDMEVLTENGFVRFDALTKSELIAQYEQTTKEITFIKPLRYIEKEVVDHNMITITSDKKINITTTEDHEYLIEYPSRPKKIKAKNVKGANKINVAGFATGPQTKLTSFEKFMIAFQADGTFHSPKKLHFSFSKQRKLDLFLELMKEGNFTFKEIKSSPAIGKSKKSKRFSVESTIKTKNLWEIFDLKSLSLEKARSILEYMVNWDGNVPHVNMLYYSSTDKRNTDFYQCVALLSGYATNQVVQKDDRSPNFNDIYRLFIRKRTSTITTQLIEKKEHKYTGKVYCVTVPTGNIIVRRNGKVAVCGNCHRIESELYKYAEVSLSRKAFNPIWDIMPKKHLPYFKTKKGFGDVDTTFAFIEEIIEVIQTWSKRNSAAAKAIIERLGGEYTGDEDLDDTPDVSVNLNDEDAVNTLKEIDKLLTLKNKLEVIVKMREEGTKFVIRPQTLGFQKQEWTSSIVTPLKVSHLHELAFRMGHKVLLMSATPGDPRTLAKSLGITDYHFMKIPYTFTKHENPIYYYGVGSMNMRERDSTMPKMARAISKISGKHKEQKGLVQTYTYAIAKALYEYLRDDPRFVWQLTAEDKQEAFRHHCESPDPTILIGPGYKEGVDLKGKLCEFQLIVKMPYADLGDPLIKARKDDDQRWYSNLCAIDLTQMLGRPIRSEDDQAVQYILDSSIFSFLDYNQDLLPQHIRERMFNVSR